MCRRAGPPVRLDQPAALFFVGLHEALPLVRHARLVAGVFSDVCSDARRLSRASRLRFG
jgi:hypothetical protein